MASTDFESHYALKDENYYSILKVGKSADLAEIKIAFRKMSRRFHPDVKPNDAGAAAKFQFVQEAYRVLADRQKREIYDFFGRYSDDLSIPKSELSEPVWALIEGAFWRQTALTYFEAEQAREIYPSATIATVQVAARLARI